jgi:hypothetical protein
LKDLKTPAQCEMISTNLAEAIRTSPFSRELSWACSDDPACSWQ